MRIRQRALRGVAAATAAAALVVGLSGCMSAETDDGPSGPNGYALGATLGEDVEVWYDLGEDTGMTDVILTQDGRSEPIGVCLGGGGTICVVGDVATEPYVIYLGPQGAGAVMTWYGAPIEMTVVEATDPAAPGVFVAAPPPGDPAALTVAFSVTDAAGTVIWTQ